MIALQHQCDFCYSLQSFAAEAKSMERHEYRRVVNYIPFSKHAIVRTLEE